MSAIAQSSKSGTGKRILAVVAALTATACVGLGVQAKPADAEIIPCTVSVPTVLDAGTLAPFSIRTHRPSLLASTAWVRCSGSTSVTISLEWLRNGALVNSKSGYGTSGASATAVTACIPGASYQAIAVVKATASRSAGSATGLGPWGYFCG
jgi:hypothetical protein